MPILPPGEVRSEEWVDDLVVHWEMSGGQIFRFVGQYESVELCQVPCDVAPVAVSAGGPAAVCGQPADRGQVQVGVGALSEMSGLLLVVCCDGWETEGMWYGWMGGGVVWIDTVVRTTCHPVTLLPCQAVICLVRLYDVYMFLWTVCMLRRTGGYC